MNLELDTLVLDWDGTIFNSFPAVIQTYIPLYKELAGGDLDTKWFSGVYSSNPQKNLETLGIDLSKSPRAMEIFFEHFPHLSKNCIPFKGMEAILEELSLRFPKMGICTYSKRGDVKILLEKHRLERFFQVVVGFEDLTEKDERGVLKGKPHPQSLNLTLQTLGAVPEKTVYVGDAEIDYGAGRRAGVKLVGLCTYGKFEKEQDLRDLNADIYFETPEKLLQLREFTQAS